MRINCREASGASTAGSMKAVESCSANNRKRSLILITGSSWSIFILRSSKPGRLQKKGAAGHGSCCPAAQENVLGKITRELLFLQPAGNRAQARIRIPDTRIDPSPEDPVP